MPCQYSSQLLVLIQNCRKPFSTVPALPTLTLFLTLDSIFQTFPLPLKKPAAFVRLRNVSRNPTTSELKDKYKSCISITIRDINNYSKSIAILTPLEVKIALKRYIISTALCSRQVYVLKANQARCILRTNFNTVVFFHYCRDISRMGRL